MSEERMVIYTDAPELCEKSPDSKHCWHSTGKQYESYPPQNEERCCWCGEYRRIQLRHKQNAEAHGEYMPKETD